MVIILGKQETGRGNRDDQYIFCYNPRLNSYAKLDDASIVKPNGSKVMTSGEGYCDISEADSYSSARSNSLTQVNITRPSAVTVGQGDFESVTQGSGINVDDSNNESAVFSIRSTSILPSLSSASKEKINACLKKPIAPNDGSTKSLDECMKDEGVATKTLVQQAYVKNIADETVCYGFGVGDGTVEEDCQELLNVNASGQAKGNIDD